jgi:hypothetical protein
MANSTNFVGGKIGVRSPSVQLPRRLWVFGLHRDNSTGNSKRREVLAQAKINPAFFVIKNYFGF